MPDLRPGGDGRRPTGVPPDAPAPVPATTPAPPDPAPTVVGEVTTARSAEAAFEELYRREFAAITAVVRSLTGRRDVAEEIVQDAFVIAHDRWSRVSTYDRPGDFVRRVALNRAVSSLRRRGAEHRALERWQRRVAPATNDVAGADEELWAAVRRLPAKQAHAVALLYVEDQPVARVAEILGCSENTVKTHLKRARASLAAALEPQRTAEREEARRG